MTDVKGDIQGTTFACDAATPVPGIQVEAVDAESGVTLAGAAADANGRYLLAGIVVGAPGFTVRAHEDGGWTLEQSGAFSAEGEVLEVPFTLPVSVVRGHRQVLRPLAGALGQRRRLPDRCEREPRRVHRHRR